MEKFEIFNNEKLGKVRTVTINNEIWFVLTDICKILGIKNITQMASRLDEDERSMFNIGRQGKANIINESGLYKVLFRSDKPEAKEFSNWITKEVIPSIRKTGKYDINQPKQLTLPKPKEHKIIKKYYNGVPVMSMRDLAYLVGCSLYTVHHYAGENKVLINGHKMVNFKKENPNLPKTLANMVILYREEVISIIRRTGTLGRLQNQISAYFDNITPEVSDEGTEHPIADQNMKAEKLLQVLPHITEEGLKNHVVTEVIRLIDNKILEEYKNGSLGMRFIDSSEKIIEMHEFNNFKMTLVKTDKPIEEFISPNYTVSNVQGNKLIVEKIK
ncbi:Bro-N domain-containing protein [Sebaldella sp. S0638]|uniref:BRO-N domain-containing protein n=1 Tax=Sebaldella sp. S0638 TaxID=2957809 RepID=UPI0020A10FE9|nr:Bro-N domain-containing protein [Sebaldella sp. S0638]MCP1224855.1 Bro-N domain-containing protein [Sebaldella sp. S0638]